MTDRADSDHGETGGARQAADDADAAATLPANSAEHPEGTHAEAVERDGEPGDPQAGAVAGELGMSACLPPAVEVAAACAADCDQADASSEASDRAGGEHGDL